MAEARRACPHASRPSGGLTCTASAIGVGDDVINDVIRMVGVTRNSANTQEMVEAQIVANAPGNVVIRAGGVAAHTHSADNYLIRCVPRKSAAEHVHAT